MINFLLIQIMFQSYPHLRDLILPLKNYCEVSLLNGANVPKAFCIEQVQRGKAKQAAVAGMVVDWTRFEHKQRSDVSELHGYTRRLVTRAAAVLVKTGFADTQCNSIPNTSKEDKFSLNVMERCVTFENGHSVMLLMWRPDAPELPCNRN